MGSRTSTRFTRWSVPLVAGLVLISMTSCRSTEIEVDYGALVPTPSLSLQTPSPSYDTTPTFRVSNLDISAGTLTVYGDGACGTALGSFGFPAFTVYVEFDLIVSAPGTGAASVKVSYANGQSQCSNSKSYTLSSPPVPTGITLVTPSASPSYDVTPYIQVSGVGNGVTVEVHNNASCSSLVGSGTAYGSTLNLTLSSLNAGTHSLYAKTKTGSLSSSCSSVLATYEVLVPPVPTSLSLMFPGSSPNYDPTPTIQVGGVGSNMTVNLFSDSGCTTQVGSATSYGSTVNVTSSALSVGAHSFYANAVTTAGTSTCSTASVNYELILYAAPTGMTLVTPSASPGYYRTPVVNVTGLLASTYVRVYDDSSCTNELGYTYTSGISADVNLSALADGVHSFYAKTTDSAGGTSNCSSLLLNYEITPRTPLTQSSYSIGSTLKGITSGDFDGDGNNDVVLTDYQSYKVYVYMGTAPGVLSSTPLQFTSAWFEISPLAFDFDKDGLLDLATLDEDGWLIIHIGNGDGTFVTGVTYDVKGTGAYDNSLEMKSADFDGDGNEDIAVVTSTSGGLVNVLLGNGDGTFQTKTSYTTSATTRSLDVGDLDGDGFPDIVVSELTSVSVLLNNGDGTFASPAAYTVSGSTKLKLADLDNDLDLDIVSSSGSTYKFQTLLNDGSGAFGTLQSVGTLTSSSTLEVGDFDLDGNIDVISSNYVQKSFSIYYGSGDGTFVTETEDYSIGVGTSYPFFVYDLDSDGDLEIMIGHLFGWEYYENLTTP